ncbi:MAG: hypothetical protein F4Z52_04390 [Gammaproteobacteria bacterium]|nr:hypothetical protein [Gammaproteobacteria bacterium]
MSEHKIVDAKNTYCPGPRMELSRCMKQADVGDTLELLSTDSGTANDVPEWVAKIGHELVSSEQIDDVWHVTVKKVK